MGDIKGDIIRLGDCGSLIQDIHSQRKKTSQDVVAAVDIDKRRVGIDVHKTHSLTALLSDSHRNKSRYVLGIIEEFDNNHLPYIAACEDLGVRYKTIDISGPDWIPLVRG